MTELNHNCSILADHGTHAIAATETDEPMPFTDTCSTTVGIEGTLKEPACAPPHAEAAAGNDGSSTVTATPAESTPPSTQPATSQQVSQETDFSPAKKSRVDEGPLVLQVAEQLSASDAQHMIVDAFNRRAFELSLGVDLAEEFEEKAPPPPGRGEPDVDMCDAMAVDGCPPALAVAEQISVDDAQNMIIECFNERAAQLEREELAAKASYMAALAARGGT
jgi:hypothetical protein